MTQVTPYQNHNISKKKQVALMFNKIAPKYDLLNRLLSIGIDKIWRRKLVKMLSTVSYDQILDIATGTGDICIKAFKYLNPEKALGVDISDKMMEIGKEKVKVAGLEGKIDFEVQDAATLTYTDNSFDAVTISFGIRNFEKLDESLGQIHRVLRPKGHLLILEMNEPQKGLLLSAYKLYTRIFVKMTSRMLSADSRAYDYLTTSMKIFASGKALIEILESHNFKLKKYKKFSFGVCSMYLVQKV